MWYIGIDINETQARSGIGGLGHTMFDLLTPIIIGKMFDIQPLYSSLKTAHLTSSDTDWNNIIRFYKDEQLLVNFLNDESFLKVNINICNAYHSPSYNQLKDFLSHFDKSKNILFLVTNNNRIHINELYFYSLDGRAPINSYNEVITSLINKCAYKSVPQKNQVVLHIRRGDWEVLSLNYYSSIINTLHEIDRNLTFDILSAGSVQQMSEIETFSSNFIKLTTIPLNLHLNTSNLDSFKLMLNAHILVCGKSSFSKITSIYNKGLKILTPFITQAKSYLNFEINYQGYCLEKYGKYYVLADEKGSFNIDEFKILLSEVHIN